ncbi:hypothetical protein [Methylobacterium sp. J-076]|uniref:head-tail connector protein n=1 Tax=Methylobacterium sp. J-076 TaxID=2836655 RepID=UPI001FBAD749|nr:hypothetical protein [Methylobacterium sp. J-076]MCJ2011229.1 hypothetical protein [Methylobacterium sp. J-076]
MTPIRAETPPVEPVSVAELRRYLRLDADDGGAEDDILARLLAAARTSLETEARRVLVPGRYRIVLDRWPAEGWLPLPLSPLVGLVRAGLAAPDGTVTDLPAGTVRPGPDPVEAPALQFVGDLPDLVGRSVVIEVTAGFGGDGPPLPEDLRLAILRLAAAGYEHRGDEPDADPTALRRLAASSRRLRLR